MQIKGCQIGKEIKNAPCWGRDLAVVAVCFLFFMWLHLTLHHLLALSADAINFGCILILMKS